MKTSSRHAALFLIPALTVIPSTAFAEEKTEALYEIALDMDRDGKPDRAVLVLTGPGRTDFHPLTKERYGLSPGESVDLYIYLAGGGEKLDPSLEPSFVKKAIVDPERTPWVQPLESDGDGSLLITGVYGWGASKTWGETLTVSYREGEFVVAGYAKDWDWNTHAADGNVETEIGGCEIDFLAGTAVATQGLDEESRPIEGTFTPVKLADWTGDDLPEACEF